MQLHHRSFKLLVTGRSGTGKTTYFVNFIAGSAYRRIFLYDHEGELQLVTGAQPCFTPDELVKAVEGGARLVLFDPSGQFPGDVAAGFAFFCEWVFEVCRALPGEKLFGCDELQKLVGTSQMPWELSLLLETGRRAGIDAAFISQQPNIIHNRIRNLLSEVVTFQHIDAAAIKFLEDLGMDSDEIRALPVHHWICRNLETGETRSK